MILDPLFVTDFSYLLGPTDPRPTAVHVEPFSTSVYKVLACIFATTTKICTGDSSTPAHANPSMHVTTPSYSSWPEGNCKSLLSNVANDGPA